MRWRPAPTGVGRKLWHRHFAWLPVNIWGTWVWLEAVERRADISVRQHWVRNGFIWRWQDYELVEWEYRYQRSRA